jgi:cyclophilin family peptidyl-prolyl cis-trans isomerase/HEAT repeat protein
VAPSSRLGRAAAGVALLATAAGCAPASPSAAASSAPAPAAQRATPALGEPERGAFAELLRMEDARAFDLARLTTLAASPSAPVRARTALALARLGRREGTAQLRTLLTDADSSVSATAAFGLGAVADSGSVPLLSPLLASPLPTVAAEAAAALGRIRSPAAGEALLAYLGATSIAAASPDAAGAALLAVWRFPRPVDPGPITRWTASPSPEVRWRAAYAMVRRPDPRGARTLLGLASDGDPRVRALALRGLTGAAVDSAGVARADVLRLLYPALRDTDYAVRVNAARTLGSYAPAEAVDTLRALLHSPDRHLALAAMESIDRIGAGAAAAAPELESMAASEATQVFLRQSALETLALVAPARARALARSLATHASWRMRASSAHVLALEGRTGAAPLRALLDDPDSRVATAALQAAVDAAGDTLAPVRSLLLERLAAADPFVRSIALAALARLRDGSTLPLLLDAYARAQRDSVDDAALAAVDAIAALRTERLDPGGAFLARFPRSGDYLVRRKAVDLFPAARGAWGDPAPVETGVAPEVYRSLVDRYDPLGGPGARPAVIVTTEQGVLRLRLYGDLAPLTTRSFLALAAAGYFDGQEWPRVVPNFVVQGGDPRGDTSGGPGYALRDEINRARYLTGTLGMALSGPDTGGSQFFLTHSPQPHLDGIYAIFGELVEGQSVLERILPGEIIRSVRIVQ